VHNYHPCAGCAPSPLTEELMHLCKTRIGKKERQKERLPSSRDSAPIVHVYELFKRIGSFANVTTLVRTDKRSMKHITSSAVSFCFHYACHLMLRNVVLAASARILPAGKMVQAIVRFVCVPNRKPRTETVQYEYMYRYTPTVYMFIYRLSVCL